MTVLVVGATGGGCIGMPARYAMLPQHDYDGPANDNDFAYTWEHLQGLREFLHRAAAAERPVVFCVDQ